MLRADLWLSVIFSKRSSALAHRQHWHRRMRPEAGLTGHAEPQAALLKAYPCLASAGAEGIVEALHLTTEGAQAVGVAVAHLQCGPQTQGKWEGQGPLLAVVGGEAEPLPRIGGSQRH